jgi:hypothetical protein
MDVDGDRLNATDGLDLERPTGPESEYLLSYSTPPRGRQDGSLWSQLRGSVRDRQRCTFGRSRVQGDFGEDSPGRLGEVAPGHDPERARLSAANRRCENVPCRATPGNREKRRVRGRLVLRRRLLGSRLLRSRRFLLLPCTKRRSRNRQNHPSQQRAAGHGDTSALHGGSIVARAARTARWDLGPRSRHARLPRTSTADRTESGYGGSGDRSRAIRIRQRSGAPREWRCAAKTSLKSAPWRRLRSRATASGPVMPRRWRTRPATRADRLKPIPQ